MKSAHDEIVRIWKRKSRVHGAWTGMTASCHFYLWWRVVVPVDLEAIESLAMVDLEVERETAGLQLGDEA